MEKQCLECGDKIVGRVDKKFCSDGCRNAHNNKVNKDSKNLIRNTNNRLRKNYRILEILNPSKKQEPQEQNLLKLDLTSIISRVFILLRQELFITLSMTKVICL